MDLEEVPKKRKKLYGTTKLLINILKLGLNHTHLVLNGYQKLSQNKRFKDDEKIQQVLYETQDVFTHDSRSYTVPTNEFINDLTVKNVQQ